VQGQQGLALHTDTPERFEYALQSIEGSYDIGAAGTDFSGSPVVLERIA
jgi:thymidine phosphorylase